MKVELDIPDRYDGLIQKLARSWFKGDVMAYIRYTIIEAMRADMDVAWSEKVLDRNTAKDYEEKLERELDLLLP